MRSSSKLFAATAAISLAALGVSSAKADLTPLDPSLFGHFRQVSLPQSAVHGTTVNSSADTTVTLFGTGFESTEVPAYANGLTVANGTNGWSKQGTATTVVNNVLPETGAQDLLWTPTATSAVTFLYRSNGAALWAPAASGGATIARQNGSYAFVNPAAGSPTTGMFAGMQYYNAANAVVAYSIVFCDPSYATDGQGLTEPYILETVWDSNNSGGIDAADNGYDYTFTTTTFADLANQYFDLSIVNNTPTGGLKFLLGGTELTGDGINGSGGTSTAAMSGPGLLVNYTANLVAGGTAPRFREDNFSLQATTVVPEPTSLGLLGVGALSLVARRRRQA